MQGKRVLITGGNGGIGLVAAKRLAEMGAEIVLAGRPGEKTNNALAEINESAETPAVSLDVDFASLEQVRNVAAEFKNRYDRLDVLVNNAGVFPAKQRMTEDGFEMQFGVNHLAPFLLTNLLLDVLKASAPARVITVSSKLHMKGKIDFDSFRGVEKYNPQTAYNQSKLANVLFAFELAERLEGTGVTSNALHPGAVATDIVRDMPWLIRKLLGVLFISPEKGAETTVMLASDPALEGVTGAYFDQGERVEASELSKDKELRTQLWELSSNT